MIMAQCTLTFCQSGQNNFPVLKGPYMGQKPPGDKPEIFAPGIVSTIGLEHSKISFSKDGTAFFWAAQPSGKTNIFKQRIWFAKKSGDNWSSPIELNLPQVALAAPTLSPDGKELFFTGSENSSNTNLNQRVKEFFVLNMADNKIRNISAEYPMLKECWSFSFADNGDIYFDNSESGRWEIYLLKKQNGKYLSPQKLSTEINDRNTNFHPFISPDSEYLLFASSRTDGPRNADLYVSFKDKNGRWTDAKSLTKACIPNWRERFPSVSADGKYLFFTRRNDDDNDFYWVSAKIIEELRPAVLKKVK